MLFSPSSQIGNTTLANYVAYLFAQKGYITGVVELNRYAGTSPYMNLTFDQKDKNIKRAISQVDEREIIQNFIKSKHHEGLFSLSLNQENLLDDLYKFPMGEIEKVINVAKKKFDKIFIDAPANYIETGLMAAINMYPDQVIQVLDDNIVTWHKLKLYDLFFKKSKIKFNKVITIINKHHGLIDQDFISKINKSLSVLKINEVHFIPFYEGIVKANNEGEILSDITPSNKKEKMLVSSLNSIFEEIRKGPNLEKEKKGTDKKQFFLKKLFSKKGEVTNG